MWRSGPGDAMAGLGQFRIYGTWLGTSEMTSPSLDVTWLVGEASPERIAYMKPSLASFWYLDGTEDINMHCLLVFDMNGALSGLLVR